MNTKSSASNRKSPQSRADFWRTVKSYPTQVYRGMTLGKLAAYAVNVLTENGIDCGYENLTVLLYRLFPEKFALVGFPEFPDGRRIFNSIQLDAHHGGYVVGGMSTGWRLTDKGKEVSLEMKRRLQGNWTTARIQNPSVFRSRAISFVKEIERSQAYRKWVAGKMENIARFEVCDVLHGTLDTSGKVLLDNLGQFMEYSEIVKEYDEYRNSASKVGEFLLYVKANWESLMHA